MSHPIEVVVVVALVLVVVVVLAVVVVDVPVTNNIVAAVVVFIIVGPRKLALGAVHKLRHPIRGYGRVSQKMTKDDRGEGGGLAKDDR